MIPSVKECYELLQKQKVPDHIIRHSEKVALISSFLACFLNLTGFKLDLKLVTAGALLHDIKKYESILDRRLNHAEEGYKFLLSLGFKEVALIVKYHVVLPEKVVNSSEVFEEEVVFYADKRVKHEEVVSLKERFRDLRERYGISESALNRLRRLEEVSFIIEKKLFSKLDFNPEILLKFNSFKKEAKDVLEAALKDCPSCWRDIF